MGTIYTNLPGSWYVPGIYVNVDLGRGTPSAALQSRRVLLIGGKLSWSETGWQNQFFPVMGQSATPGNPDYKYRYAVPTATNPAGTDFGKIYSISSTLMAAARFGYGSELYIMAKAAFDANPNVELYAYTHGADVGSFGATSDIRVQSDATKDGIVVVSVLGQKAKVRVKKGDSQTTVSDKIAKAFTGQLRELPYYSEVATDPTFFRFKAKHTTDLWNGIQFSMDPTDTGVTFSGSSPYSIAGGAGAYDVAAGLAYSETERYHYIVISRNDATNVGRLVTHLEKMALPENGYREQGLFGSTESFAAISAKVGPPSGCICPRVQCVWVEGSNYFPGQLAASTAAARQGWEGSDVAVNLCYKEVKGVPMVPDDKLMTITQKNAALVDGITPLVPHQGRMSILRSVTCATGATTGQVIDTGKVTVSDFIADDIEIKMASRYKGFKLSPDTDIPLPSRVTTPSGIKKSLLEWLRMSEKAGRITRVTELAPAIKVEIDTEVDGRVNFEIPEDVVDIFAVGAGNIIQIG